MTRAIIALLFWSAAAQAAALDHGPVHDKAYWQQIIQDSYAVPANASAFALTRELTQLLGSTDPELRDRIAFSILHAWISGKAQYTADELASLQSEWQANLRDGIQDGASDKTLKRSFSALCLAALVERDLNEPVLQAEKVRELLDASLEYLASERDLRGFDEKKGWIHATAHTADLLAALARHPRTTVDDQSRILAGVTRRLTTAPEVFTQGEQDRLAQAVTALVLRKDFDATKFGEWLTALVTAKRQAARTRPLTPAALAAYQNGTYFLQALYARMSVESLDAAKAKSRDAVLDTLRPR